MNFDFGHACFGVTEPNVGSRPAPLIPASDSIPARSDAPA
jgi:hypothetical protein